MANKKTVVEQYEAIKALLNGETVEDYTPEQALAFLDNRIEITKKKNSSGKDGELTEAQKKKLAETEGLQNAVLAVMTANTLYTPTDLVKAVNHADIPSTQKITPLLTALVANGKVKVEKVKGRSNYSLVAPATEE